VGWFDTGRYLFHSGKTALPVKTIQTVTRQLEQKPKGRFRPSRVFHVTCSHHLTPFAAESLLSGANFVIIPFYRLLSSCEKQTPLVPTTRSFVNVLLRARFSININPFYPYRPPVIFLLTMALKPHIRVCVTLLSLPPHLVHSLSMLKLCLHCPALVSIDTGMEGNSPSIQERRLYH